MHRPTRIILVVACLLAATAGCTSKHGAGASSTASPRPSDSLDQLLQQLPDADATPSPPPGGYPADAAAYTLSAINLWRTKQIVAAYSLIDPADNSFMSIVAGPANPDFLTFYRCESIGGVTTCTYYNPNGDTLQITVHPAQLGKPRAIFAMAVIPFAWPANRKDYAMRLLDAWRTHNAPAVSRISGLPGDSVFSELPATKRDAPWSFDGPLTSEAALSGVDYQWHDDKQNRVYFRITAAPTVSSGPINVQVHYLSSGRG